MEKQLINESTLHEMLSAPYLLTQVGAPFIIGMAVGYFAKKMLKLALFFAGGAIILLFVSEYYGIVTINDDNLQHVANMATHAAQTSSDFLLHRLSRIAGKGLSAAAGFYAGLKLS